MRTAASAIVVAALAGASCGRAEEHVAPAGQTAAARAADTPAGTSGAAGPEPGATPVDATAPGPRAGASAPLARYREITIPAGTALRVRLDTEIGSDTSRPDQRVEGTLARAVRVDGVEAIPAGAALRGAVTNADRSGVKRRAKIAFRFDQLSTRGTLHPIGTRTVLREAPDTVAVGAGTTVDVTLARALTVRVAR